MEQKIYRCNDQLELILKQLGFIECTKKFDKQSGKKTFRKGKRSEMYIHFDGQIFTMFENECGCKAFESNRIFAEDLQFLLWYIKSSLADRQNISNGHYNLYDARNSYKTMQKVIQFHREFNYVTDESKYFERLLNAYKTIQLN